MPITMIDNEIAEWVTQQLIAGERFNFITGPDNRTFNFEIVEIKPYSVIVKGAFGLRIELSIAKCELYITALEEKQTMQATTTTRMQLPADAKPKATRGRPSKGSPEKATQTAAALPPQNPFAQAGPEATPSNNGGFGFTVPASTYQPQQIPQQPQQMPIAQAEGDKDWIDKAISEAVSGFQAELTVICKSIYNSVEVSDKEEPEEKQHTCLQCVFINIAENKCDKFQITPPLFVIAEAKKQCTAYLEDDEQIPF